MGNNTLYYYRDGEGHCCHCIPLLRIYERANGVMMKFTYFIRLFELLRIVELLH